MVLLSILLIIITLHELGHLIVAKLCGCGVKKFSVGFGNRPRLVKKIGLTEYQITPWLLGGFCSLESELESSISSTAFTNLKYTRKVLIAFGGIFVNVITGGICAWVGIQCHIPLLLTFGFWSICLGVCNAIPFPALDGSIPLLVLLEKPLGKERGYRVIKRIVQVGFAFLMVLNIWFLPEFIHMLITNQGVFI